MDDSLERLINSQDLGVELPERTKKLKTKKSTTKKKNAPGHSKDKKRQKSTKEKKKTTVADNKSSTIKPSTSSARVKSRILDDLWSDDSDDDDFQPNCASRKKSITAEELDALIRGLENDEGTSNGKCVESDKQRNISSKVIADDINELWLDDDDVDAMRAKTKLKRRRSTAIHVPPPSDDDFFIESAPPSNTKSLIRHIAGFDSSPNSSQNYKCAQSHVSSTDDGSDDDDDFARDRITEFDNSKYVIPCSINSSASTIPETPDDVVEPTPQPEVRNLTRSDDVIIPETPLEILDDATHQLAIQQSDLDSSSRLNEIYNLATEMLLISAERKMLNVSNAKDRIHPNLSARSETPTSRYTPNHHSKPTSTVSTPMRASPGKHPIVQEDRHPAPTYTPNKNITSPVVDFGATPASIITGKKSRLPSTKTSTPVLSPITGRSMLRNTSTTTLSGINQSKNVSFSAVNSVKEYGNSDDSGGNSLISDKSQQVSFPSMDESAIKKQSILINSFSDEKKQYLEMQTNFDENFDISLKGKSLQMNLPSGENRQNSTSFGNNSSLCETPTKKLHVQVSSPVLSEVSFQISVTEAQKGCNNSSSFSSKIGVSKGRNISRSFSEPSFVAGCTEFCDKSLQVSFGSPSGAQNRSQSDGKLNQTSSSAVDNSILVDKAVQMSQNMSEPADILPDVRSNSQEANSVSSESGTYYSAESGLLGSTPGDCSPAVSEGDKIAEWLTDDDEELIRGNSITAVTSPHSRKRSTAKKPSENSKSVEKEKKSDSPFTIHQPGDLNTFSEHLIKAAVIDGEFRSSVGSCDEPSSAAGTQKSQKERDDDYKVKFLTPQKRIVISDDDDDDEEFEKFLTMVKTPAKKVSSDEEVYDDENYDDDDCFIVPDDCYTSDEDDGDDECFYIKTTREVEEKERNGSESCIEIDDNSESDDPVDFEDSLPDISSQSPVPAKIPGDVPKTAPPKISTSRQNPGKFFRSRDREESEKNKEYSFMKSLDSDIPSSRRHPGAEKYVTNFQKYREELTNKLMDIFCGTVFQDQFPEPLKVEWRPRLTKSAGYCYNQYKDRVNRLGRNCIIALSDKVCDSADRTRDTIIHELCHAAVWVVNGSREAHGRIWKSWAAKANRQFPEIPVIGRCHDYKIATKFTYRCVNCGDRINRHSKSLDTERFVCGACGGKFECLINKKNGTTVPSGTKTPNRFAMFVKDNYSTVKQRQSSKSTHKQIMNILSKDFANLNKISSLSGDSKTPLREIQNKNGARKTDSTCLDLC